MVRVPQVIRLKQEEHIASERALLALIQHPFVVHLYRTFQNTHCVHMLLEYVNGGEVFSHLRKAGRFSKEFTKFYAGQIILVLQVRSRLVSSRNPPSWPDFTYEG